MIRFIFRSWLAWLSFAVTVLGMSASAEAAVKPHPLFTDNAVLQQKVKVPVWGTTDSADKVTVSVAGQEGSDSVKVNNVLVGEVWICSGQSNMEWPLKMSDGGSDAIANSRNEKIRLFMIPNIKADTPQETVPGSWTVAGPETVGDFSGVGYFFGRALQKHLGVPIGLISSDWGGTAAEQWTSAEALAANPELKGMSTNAGPSLLYNAMIAPLAPLAFQGVIWYQGESNAGRSFQYRTLLPTMIKNWRETFGHGDFPFLIVQIAPFTDIVREPSDSVWAEIRDAQLDVSRKVPNTALIVTTDVGDEKDIHPRKKEPVGARLALAARALAYGEKIEYSGPQFDKLSVQGDKAVLHFTHAGSGLVAKDGSLSGFTIAGEDQKFHAAQAEIKGDTIEVSSPDVAKPVAVRYGWAGYPVVNLWNGDALPASPFRTDSFPITTQNAK